MSSRNSCATRGRRIVSGAYEEALDAGVDRVYAKRLLDPNYPPEPEVYIKRKPRRPLLAKRRTAFVFDTH